MELIFDLEGDGLYPTKIHCLSYRLKGKIYTTFDYEKMKEVLLKATTLIGHNIICFDIPVIERILKIKIKARLIDTLALSWYLNPDRNIHGLDSFGKDFNIPKPKIDDWENLTKEEYGYRCEEDVKINTRLWQDLKTKLLEIYETKEQADKLVRYLSFKMDCAREQKQSRWKFNRELAQRSYDALEEQQAGQIAKLVQSLPKRLITAIRTKPAKPYKKDGTLSVYGVKWFDLLREQGLPEDYEGEVEVVIGEEEANPNSTDQVKAWLYSLGWEPCTYKYVKNEDGEERKVEQVRKDGELTPSVLALAEKEPDVELLEGLTVIQHRLSIFKGFLECDENGWLTAEIAGLTNTLRFKHKKPLVNLPGVDKAWGKEIRGCLTAPEGHVLCGSDMVSLEDNTKRHYMYFYDPEYVNEMSKKGFDPHLDLAKHAGAVTQEDINEYNRIDELDTPTKEETIFYKGIKAIRKKYKQANYSCIYGVGGPKLSRELGIPLNEGLKLKDAYWQRNWAVQKLSEDQEIKTVRGKMWLKNPVSGFYYSLRYKKDTFSTLNQGTGVYCFDRWIAEWRKVRPQLTGQFHDEIIACLLEKHKERYEQLLRGAIKKVNDSLKLNILLDIDVQFGETYAEIH